MAKRELGPAALKVAQAVAARIPREAFVVGCSGGADSVALTLGAQWAARRKDIPFRALIVDHGLQGGSAQVAQDVAASLEERGVDAQVVAVDVSAGSDGVEAAARDARLAALEEPGRPVLLGHTLDDQAENVLLGLLRGSGARSLAGMAEERGPFIRPLLGLRRADTVAACGDWGVTPWHDPMNEDTAYSRVRARRLLSLIGDELGRDVAPALARTAGLLRADADLLDQMAAELVPDPRQPAVAVVASLPDAIRGRVLHRFLSAHGVEPTHAMVASVDALVTHWRGQGPLAMPGGAVARRDGHLCFDRKDSP